MTDPKINVLVIDDDDLTAEIIQRALTRQRLDHEVVMATDGIDGLNVLRGKTDRHVARPYLILLDLNMPRMNGFEFLQSIRSDEDLRSSVIFVLTTSDSDSDRSRAYNENIAGYMVKSAIGPQFSNLVTLLRSYTDTILLPN